MMISEMWLFGSGFSKSIAKLPTLGELRLCVNQYLNSMDINKWAHLRLSKDFLKMADIEFPWANYEELLTIAWNPGLFTAQSYHKAIAEEGFDTLPNDDRYLLYRERENKFEWVKPKKVQESLAIALAGCFIDLESKAILDMEMVKEIISIFSNGGFITTINNDTILERIFDLNNIPFCYDFSSSRRGWHDICKQDTPSIKLYKLHGSVNWFFSRGRPVPYSYSPQEILPLLKRGNKPAIVPPSPGKILYLSRFEESWKTFFVQGSMYNVLYIVGCGFPDTDPELSVLFRSIIYWIAQQKKKLKIIDINYYTGDNIADYINTRKQIIGRTLGINRASLLSDNDLTIDVYPNGFKRWLEKH